jgi:hypothetical protein
VNRPSSRHRASVLHRPRFNPVLAAAGSLCLLIALEPLTSVSAWGLLPPVLVGIGLATIARAVRSRRARMASADFAPHGGDGDDDPVLAAAREEIERLDRLGYDEERR